MSQFTVVADEDAIAVESMKARIRALEADREELHEMLGEMVDLHYSASEQDDSAPMEFERYEEIIAKANGELE